MTPLVLAAHGSTDERFAEVISSLASLIIAARPSLEVRIGYLDHGVPLESVTDKDCVVVPVLLSSGFHVHTDIPARAVGTVTRPVGPDRRLIPILLERLHQAGWTEQTPLVLAATGSSDSRALDDVGQIARGLGEEVGCDVQAAFISDGDPRLRDVAAAAVASYLLAPGRFADLAAQSGAPIVAAPLGAHRGIAEIILDRYDSARLGRET